MCLERTDTAELGSALNAPAASLPPCSAGVVPAADGTIACVLAVVPANCVSPRASCDAVGTCSGSPQANDIAVKPGQAYRLTVSGTYIGGLGDKGCATSCLLADARYQRCSDGLAQTPWADQADSSDYRGTNHFDLQIWDGTAYTTPTWNEPYNDQHTYSLLVTSQSNTLRLRVNDEDAGDNGGSLRVELEPVACGDVGQPCCSGHACSWTARCDSTDTCAAYASGPESCRSGQVAATDSTSPPLEIPVQPGASYTLTAFGTYQAAADTQADVRYQSQNNGPWQAGSGVGLQILSGSGASEDWGGFTIEHRYSRLWRAENTSLLQVRLPGQSGSSLTLQVCPATCGNAGQACCWGSTCAAGASCDAAGQCLACAAGQPNCPGACVSAQAGGSSCQGGLEFAVQQSTLYRLAASGTYAVSYLENNDVIADAQCNKFAAMDVPWADALPKGGTSASVYDLQLLEGGTVRFPSSSQTWGTCNPEHRYNALWAAETNRLCLRPNVDGFGTAAGSLQASVCEVSCSSDTQCAPSYFCVNNRCVSLKPNGAACTANNQCQSAFCIDGYCCNSSCGGACDRCNVAGHLGSCSPAAGDLCNDNNACTSSDMCNATAQCIGTPVSCNDNNACTNDSCNPATGCVYSPFTGGGTTTCGIGACQRTVQNCVSGVAQTCAPGSPTTEVCNGIDDDCDGLVDEGVLSTFYRDADGDRYGNPSVSTQACAAPIGYVSNGADCNDSNANINPAATEVCNGVDDNCNGSIDEVRSTFYRDADGDGYGNSAVTTQACSAPSGYVSNASDCNDSNAAIHPGASEICDGIDNNCNGRVDESCCVGNVGASCETGTYQTRSGCGTDYVCASFWAVYYNSPGGCTQNAGSWLEYSFDGVHELVTTSNGTEILGDATSAYHCTYVGNGTWDPFHNVPNGQCFNSSAAGYPIDNTWTRVVLGSGCSHPEFVPTGSGTIQCDGSCR